MSAAVDTAYVNQFNLSLTDGIDETVLVAILDSLYHVPEKDLAETVSISHTEDFVNCPDRDDTTGHGSIVFRILSQHTINAEYELYRVVDRSGVVLQRDLLRGIGRAHIRRDVDIINLSLGLDHSHEGVSCDMPNEPCKVREAAIQAIDDGITVVAAAGNATEPSNDDQVCCPALADEVISVGGVTPACGAAAVDMTPNDPSRPRKFNRPPRAVWITNSEDLEVDGIPICSNLDCGPGHSCDEQRTMIDWPGNVESGAGTIDVLAPVSYPMFTDEGVPGMSSGTSFSAPFVSSIVVNMIALLKDSGHEYSPSQIQNAIVNTAKEVDMGEGRYVNAGEAIKQIGRRKGVKIELD